MTGLAAICEVAKQGAGPGAWWVFAVDALGALGSAGAAIAAVVLAGREREYRKEAERKLEAAETRRRRANARLVVVDVSPGETTTIEGGDKAATLMVSVQNGQTDSVRNVHVTVRTRAGAGEVLLLSRLLPTGGTQQMYTARREGYAVPPGDITWTATFEDAEGYIWDLAHTGEVIGGGDAVDDHVSRKRAVST
jgi:hypothetical protein